MEYNPVAINEVLAYSFQTGRRRRDDTIQNNRFFIELVNTLTAAYNPNYDYGSPPTNTANNYYGNASTLDLGGFNYTSGRSLLGRLLGPGLHGRQPDEPARPLPGRPGLRQQVASAPRSTTTA